MGIKERKIREFKKRAERIQKVSISLFKKNHPANITMEMISQKAEIGRGTLYLHFKSKDDLLASIVLDYYNGLRQNLETSQLVESPKNRAVKLIREFIRYTIQNKELYSIVKSCSEYLNQENISIEIQEKLKTERKLRLDLLKNIYTDIKKSGNLKDIRVYSHVGAVWGMLKGAIDIILDGHFVNEIEDIEDYFNIVESILFKGVFLGEL